jgi:nicotinamide-nucleotide amidase
MGHLLTETPGSSAYVQGGIIAYDNAVKMNQLGVEASVLEQKGAVCAEVALQMAKGVAERLCVECGISSTGVAGPGGGSPGKPVGTVWLGFYTPAEHFAVRAEFSHSRSLNKLRSVITSFEILRRCLLGMDELPYNLQKVYPASVKRMDQAQKGSADTSTRGDLLHS